MNANAWIAILACTLSPESLLRLEEWAGIALILTGGALLEKW